MKSHTERIIINENICNGKPVIKGTRITVQTILEYLSAGDSASEILKEYPSLKPDDIKACLMFASKLMDNKYSVKELA